MQIFHLNWINKEKDKNFFLWGESSREKVSKKISAAKLHPFCCIKEELVDIFKVIVGEIKPGDRYDKLTFSLPAFKRYPLASSNLILKTDEEYVDAQESKAELSQFKVNGMWLTSHECLSFLISISDIPIKDEVILGADIYFLNTILNYNTLYQKRRQSNQC